MARRVRVIKYEFCKEEGIETLTKSNLISEMSSVFLCSSIFLSIQVIESQRCLWISKTFSLTLSKVFQKYL